MNLEKTMEAASGRALDAIVGKMDSPLALGINSHLAQKAFNVEASLQRNPSP